MSTETIKSDVSVSDTSHLKVPFPYKKKYGNYINENLLNHYQGNTLIMLVQ